MNITVTIPAALWLSANDRLHWREKAKRTAWLRAIGKSEATRTRLPRIDRAIITTHVSYPRAGRADPSNAAPTVKALIDGLVDAHVFVDDDSAHVVDGGYRRAGKCARQVHVLTLEITPIDEQGKPLQEGIA